MSLFALEDVLNISINVGLPDVEDNYAKLIADNIPLGSLKTENITQRRDSFYNLFDELPLYQISGDDIRISISKNELSIVLGNPPFPFVDISPGREIEKSKIMDINTLNKISMDINYILGVLFSTIEKRFGKFNIKGQLSVKGNKGANISFNSITIPDGIKNINGGIKVSGIALKKDMDNEKNTYYIRNGGDEINITSWFEYVIESSIDIYEIIESQLETINEISLNM